MEVGEDRQVAQAERWRDTRQSEATVGSAEEPSLQGLLSHCGQGEGNKKGAESSSSGRP